MNKDKDLGVTNDVANGTLSDVKRKANFVLQCDKTTLLEQQQERVACENVLTITLPEQNKGGWRTQKNMYCGMDGE